MMDPANVSLTFSDYIFDDILLNTDEKARKASRITLKLDEKVKILQMVEEKRLKKFEIAQKFNLATSTLSTIIKNKHKILNAFRMITDPSRKRVRSGAHPELEEMMYKWVSEANARGFTVTRQLMKTKVQNFVKRLGIPGFKVSDGWVYRFKKRHGVLFSKLPSKHSCGETARTQHVSRTETSECNRNISNDSDGACSDQSSDSSSAVHPVQLLQSEKPNRLKRSISECRPDFVFYGNRKGDSNVDQLIVPYVQNNCLPEWPDSSEGEETAQPQIKTEESYDEDLSPASVSSYLPEKEYTTDIAEEDVSSTEMEALQRGPSGSTSSLALQETNETNRSFALPSVQESITDTDVSQTLNPVCEEDMETRSDSTINNRCSAGSVHTCQALMRLAVSLERQAKVQEEMLTLKKQRHSLEERYRKEELELLKQKLSVEERKVQILEQLLAAYIHGPKKT